MSNKTEGRRLKAAGYCVINFSSRAVARIDRADWAEFTDCPDDYRRCISRDVLHVSEGALRHIPDSAHSGVDYEEETADKP